MTSSADHPVDRFVVFDAAGTLIRPARPVADTYAEFGRQHGSRLESDEIHNRFHQARREYFGWRPDRGAVRTSESREKQNWLQLVKYVFMDVDQPHPLFERLWNYFANADAWLVYDDARRCLEQFDSVSQRWAIGSNFDGRLEEICRGHPEFDSATGVFISSRIGFRKPDREFFEWIQRRTSIAPSRLLMVGNSLENDVSGAVQAGWHAVLIDRQPAQPAQAIRSLDELPQVIDELFDPAS